MAQDLHIGQIPEFDELKEDINSFSFLEDKQFDESEWELILQKAAEGDMQGTLSLLESLDFGAPSVEQDDMQGTLSLLESLDFGAPSVEQDDVQDTLS